MKNMLIKKCLLASSFLVVCGCAQTDEKPVPELAQELQYTADIEKTYGADKEWWKIYGMDDLNALVDLALKNNPDYIKAAINIEKQMYNLSLTRSDLFPTLSGTLGAAGTKKLNNGSESSSKFSGDLGIKYEVDLYGKISDLVAAQEFEYNATLEDYESARLSLINSVVDFYFNLEYLRNVIEIAEKDVATYQNILTIMQHRYDEGKSDQLELTQAKQSLIAEQNSLIASQTQFREVEKSLRNILMLKPGDELKITYTSILAEELVPVNLDVPVAVLANRPDLKAAQYRVQKSFKTFKSKEKNWYPTITLNGAIGSSSDKIDKTFSFPLLSGAVSVNLPFLDWNRVKNNVKISEADYNIALVGFKDTLVQALNELAYYDYAYQLSIRTFENVGKNVVNTEKITDYYTIRYKAGKAAFKDLLQAIYAENATRKNLLKQKYQIIKYENYIYKSMGGRYYKL